MEALPLQEGEPIICSKLTPPGKGVGLSAFSLQLVWKTHPPVVLLLLEVLEVLEEVLL
jgi:hypothetical protein